MQHSEKHLKGAKLTQILYVKIILIEKNQLGIKTGIKQNFAY